MPYKYHDLKLKTVAELREIAKDVEHEAVKGYTQLNKEHLLKALCVALKIDVKEHHEVVGIDKAAVKLQIRELKKQRDALIGKDKSAELRRIKRKIHRLKREIRKALEA